jgi:hypothetical protein
VSLGPVQEAIVRALYDARHDGRYLSVSDLVERVYGGTEPDWAECSIRRTLAKLGPWLAARNVALVNCWGRGYRIERLPLHADEVAA